MLVVCGRKSVDQEKTESLELSPDSQLRLL